MSSNLNFKSLEESIKSSVKQACYGNAYEAMKLLQPLGLDDAQKETVFGYFQEATRYSDPLDLQKKVISVQPFPFLEMPLEIQCTALFNLKVKGIINCSSTCKDLYAIIKGDPFSRAVFCRDFQGRFPMPASGFFRACSDSYRSRLNFQDGIYGKRIIGNQGSKITALGGDEIFYSATSDGKISIWDFDVKTCTSTIQRDETGNLALKFANGRFYSGRSRGAIEVLDPKMGECFLTLKVAQTQKEENGNVIALAYGDDGFLYAASDKRIDIWDPKTGKCLDALEGSAGFVRTLVFCDGQGVLCSGDTKGMIKVWDVKTRTCLHTLQAHDKPLFSLVFLDNVLYSSSNDGRIKAWDPVTGSCLERSYVGPDGIIRLTPFHGYLCATVSAGRIDILDPKTLNTLYALNMSEISAIPASFPSCFNGKFCAASSAGELHIWDFMEKDVEIFKELAGLFRKNDQGAIREAMNRFSRMPEKAKIKIFELCGISVLSGAVPAEKIKELWASVPAEKKAEAIEAYVKSQEEG